MRKHNTILCVATLALAAMMTGCDDLMEPAKENNLGVDYMYKNPQYAEGVLANAYTYMICDGYNFSEMATDDAVSSATSNGFRSMAAGTWTSSSNPVNEWENAYNKIMYLNIFHNRCNDVTWAKDPIAARMYNDRERGEAYGLRAMNYYYLLQAHAGYADDGVLYGVPLYLNEMQATDNYNVPRNTFADCLQQVYNDCDSALALLPDEYADISDESLIPAKYKALNATTSQYNRVFGSKFKGRMVGTIVKAYRAKLALMAASPAYNPMGNAELWQQAAEYAAELLDHIGGVSGMDANGWTWYANTSEISGLSGGENPKEIVWRGGKFTNNNIETQLYPPSLYG